MKKINITFCSFPDFSGNAKALYEYMIERRYANHRYVWVVYNESSREKLLSQNIEAVLIGSDEFREYIKTTDMFFTTQGNLDGDKTENSFYIELWHGVGPKAVGYLCNNPSPQDVKGYDNIRKIVDYLIVPSDFWKIVATAKFHIEAKRIMSLGMPIFDYFVYSDGKTNLFKILGIEKNKYKKIIFYMPTYKKGFNHNDIENINTENIFNFPKYNEEELDDFLKENNYLLCVKRHPGEENEFKKITTDNIVNIDDSLLFNHDLSINEIINGCDLMITDYSSIGTEFVFLDKPILYALDNLKEYQNKRGIVFSNFQFWAVGPICKTIEELIEESFKLLNNSEYYAKERQWARDLWFDELKDGGCDKICDFLFEKNGNIKKSLVHYKNAEKKLEKEISILNSEIENLKIDKDNIEKQLSNVLNSKGWKLLEKLRRMKRKFVNKEK